MVDACLLRDYKKRPSIHDILKKPIMSTKAKALGIAIPDDKLLKDEYEAEKQERIARKTGNNLKAMQGVKDAVGNAKSQLEKIIGEPARAAQGVASGPNYRDKPRAAAAPAADKKAAPSAEADRRKPSNPYLDEVIGNKIPPSYMRGIRNERGRAQPPKEVKAPSPPRGHHVARAQGVISQQ